MKNIQNQVAMLDYNLCSCGLLTQTLINIIINDPVVELVVICVYGVCMYVYVCVWCVCVV